MTYAGKIAEAVYAFLSDLLAACRELPAMILGTLASVLGGHPRANRM